MKRKMNLLEDNILKIFFKYLITSTAGMLMVSLYILFDTIFVGQGLGKEGLAALNISIPVYNLIFGTGILIGTGTATIMSISLGKGNQKKAQAAFNHSIVLGLGIGLIYTVLGLTFLEPLAILLGAGEESLPMVKEYLGVIIAFSWSFLMVYNLSNVVRNDHGPKRVMIAMGAGGITNVIFDYIFIFPMNMGMRGAAIATVMSSLASLIILALHFYKGNSMFKITSLKLQWSLIKGIGAIGVGSFIIEISSGLVIFLFNRELLKLIGDIGVSAYSIIANISLMCVAVFTGIAQGMQPISSINYGAKKLDRVYAVRKLGLAAAIAVGAFFLAFGLTMPRLIVSMFTSETGEIVNITVEGIRYYFIAFPIMGINIIMGSYFQSIGKAKYSTTISLCRGIIFTIVGLKILSYMLGVTGVWVTVPVAEVGTLIIVAMILLRKKK
jgi:putative MATE family efflux protein